MTSYKKNMSDKNSFIKIPPGSKVEIKNDHDKDIKDLGSSESNSNYRNKESKNIDLESTHTGFETSSSSQSSNSSIEANTSASSTSNYKESEKENNDAKTEKEFEKELFDDVKQVDVDANKRKNTIRVKIKNFFKFK